MRERSRARGWALQALYAWESRGEPETPLGMLEELERDRSIADASVTYARQLLHNFQEHRTDVDRAIQESLSNWRLERLSVIDRNILRLATSEMMHIADVPPRVSIQEAIELAEKYGTHESPRFVNGVLDALMRAQAGAHDQENA
ncbi:MAG: transcription antitermination factor NusB [Longimicrobiales bacterium]